jgi:hypothetical protein
VSHDAGATRNTTKSCNNSQNCATACLFKSSSLAAASCCRCCCTSCACACRREKSSLQRDPAGPSQPHVEEEEAVTPCTRLRRNKRLAIVGLQQTDVRDCQEPLLQTGNPMLRRSSYTVHTRLRCNPILEERRRSVTRRSSDYIATNRWLGKGCSREEQGAVTSPTSKGLNGTNVLKLTIAHPPQRSPPHVEKEEAVTLCTRDYVATNGWLSKGRNRLQTPC